MRVEFTKGLVKCREIVINKKYNYIICNNYIIIQIKIILYLYIYSEIIFRINYNIIYIRADNDVNN